MQEIKLSKDIEITHIKTHSPEWYKYRNSGIGSSETSSILGLTDYPFSSVIDVFARKVGTFVHQQPPNENTHHGTFTEPWIYTNWEYYDGIEGNYVQNYLDKKKIRTADHYGVKDKYYRNNKYPWLFSSSDGLIHPGQTDIFTGEVRDNHGVLEIKRTSTQYLRTFESEIPSYYIPQVHHEMLVFDTDYSEIALLIDGRKLDVIPVEMTDSIKNMILDSSHDFWYKSVLPAREKKEEFDHLIEQGKEREAELIMADIHQLEPPADNSEAYKHHLSHSALQKINAEPIIGGVEEFDISTKHKRCTKLINKLNGQKRLHENTLRKFMIDNGANKIDFGDDGYARAYYREGAEKTTFDNRAKVTIDSEEVDEEFKKLEGYVA